MPLGKTPDFGVADYVIFGIIITISSGIGIYHAFTGGRQKTQAEFLLANRNFRVAPVTLSLIVSYESSILILGNPAEVYLYGAQYWLVNFGWVIALILSAQLFVPLFSNLKVVSAYEYLEHRFKSRAVRLLASFLGIMSTCWYMGVVLFGPAIALEAVTGFPVWNSVFVVALAAMFYTAVGGIKAVIWADAFQLVVMVTGMFALIIKGTMLVGGIQNVWRIADEGGRLNFFNFSVDPTIRNTFWGLIIGGTLRGLKFGTNQASVQRVATMPTLAKAKMIMFLSAPGFLFFGTMAILQGIIAYSYYRSIECDPLEAKLIDNANQVLPLFVMHIFEGLPGLPGLFIAALFSASLRDVGDQYFVKYAIHIPDCIMARYHTDMPVYFADWTASMISERQIENLHYCVDLNFCYLGLSSLCMLMWTDFLKPYIRPVNEFKATLITKGLVVLFGIISIGLAFLVMNIDAPLVQITTSISGSIIGPLTGMFLLGALFYQATAKGALIGSVVSVVFGMWMSIGSNMSSLHRKTVYLEPSSTNNCFASNSSSIFMEYLENDTSMSYAVEQNQLDLATAAPIAEESSLSGLAVLYSISFNWFCGIGIFGTIVIGLAVSFITGANKREDVNAAHLIPFFDQLFCCLPETWRAKLRCGIDYAKSKPTAAETGCLMMVQTDDGIQAINA